MDWQLRIAKRAEKSLAEFPSKDRDRLVAALGAMRSDPFVGDIVRLINAQAAWRRRIGNYRILFDLDMQSRAIEVVDIARRTSTTY